MIDLRLKTNANDLSSMFDEDKSWSNLRRLEIKYIPASPADVQQSFRLLHYLEPLLFSSMRYLSQLRTQTDSFARIDRLSISENGFPSFLLSDQWPRLRCWNTIEVDRETDAYELIRQLSSHPLLEQVSVNALFGKWNATSVKRAVRMGREILAVRNGRPMHALTLTLLCNGERVIAKDGVIQGDRSGLSVYNMEPTWEVYNVDLN